MSRCFNPHRPFRAGATCAAENCEVTHGCVSILTGPFGPVQPPFLPGCREAAEFQSSPALSGRCNFQTFVLLIRTRQVSILTGPFGPVQRVAVRARGAARRRFNPHRPFRAGATMLMLVLPLLPSYVLGFNPHRPFRAGATDTAARLAQTGRVSILTGPFGPVQPGQTRRISASNPLFQSSPALSGRCNPIDCAGVWVHTCVSILTGPFGPVQQYRQIDVWQPSRVSILTGPFGPVQPCTGRGSSAPSSRFNPHRPFRAGATGLLRRRPAQAGCFNPHRPFRAGATSLSRY